MTLTDTQSKIVAKATKKDVNGWQIGRAHV